MIEAVKAVRLIKHGVSDGIRDQGKVLAVLGSYIRNHVFMNVFGADALPLPVRPDGKDLDVVYIRIAVVETLCGRHAFIVHGKPRKRRKPIAQEHLILRTRQSLPVSCPAHGEKKPL